MDRTLNFINGNDTKGIMHSNGSSNYDALSDRHNIIVGSIALALGVASIFFFKIGKCRKARACCATTPRILESGTGCAISMTSERPSQELLTAPTDRFQSFAEKVKTRLHLR